MISVQHLTKKYGSFTAVNDISFEVEKGEVVGFLGPNGAGKSTTMKILTAFLPPTSGSAKIAGFDVFTQSIEARKRIGYLPENTPLYTDMNIVDYLAFAGELRGMSRAEIRKRMPDVLDITALGDVSQDPIGTLSHGYRQRVGVAQAIIHQPKFLILDEPTRGLDPVQIVEMRNLIHDLKQNHTVLISSHILTEISQTCDRLLVLGDGEILKSGTEETLTQDLHVRHVVVAVKRAAGDEFFGGNVAERLGKVEGVTKVDAPKEAHDIMTYTVHCDRETRAALGKAVVDSGWDLLRLDSLTSELEQTFISLVREEGDRDN